MASARTPYQDTSVPVERSKEQIRSALRSAAARRPDRAAPGGSVVTDSSPSTDPRQDDAERKLAEIRGVVIAYVRCEVSCGGAMHEIECILHGWPREARS